MTKGSIHQEDITIINKCAPKRELQNIRNIPERIKSNRQFNSNSYNFQYPTFNNGQKNLAKDQEGNRRLE